MGNYFSPLVKSEIEAAIIIASLSIITFFLPNYTIDPWHLINLQQFGIIILLIASMQFCGYFAIRLLGDKIGIALVGFFGGFISSTIIFLILPSIYKKQPRLLYTVTASAILAVIGMLIEFLIILKAISIHLFSIFFHPILIMIIISIIATVLLTREKIKGHVDTQKIIPLDLKSSLKLTIWLLCMLVMITITIRYFGTNGGAIIAFLGGLFELHSITMATSTLYIQEIISLPNATFLLSIALLGAFISKFIILGFLSRNRFALITTLIILLILMTGFISYLLVHDHITPQHTLYFCPHFLPYITPYQLTS